MFHNESSPRLTSTGLCSPMGIGQTLLNMREELSVFYIPKTISRLQNETERQETQAAQRPAALTASIFFGSRGFRKPNCPQPGSDALSSSLPLPASQTYQEGLGWLSKEPLITAT